MRKLNFPETFSKKEKLIKSSSSSLAVICFNFLFVLLLISCDEKENEPLSSVAELESFGFLAKNNAELENDVFGIMAGGQITLTVPYGISLQGLIATFSYTGAEIKVGEIQQGSDITKNNFSDPVVYHVIAEDGTKKSYTVTVTEAIPRIPRVTINTKDAAPILDKVNYVSATVVVEDLDKYYTDNVSFTATAGIRGRGNTTWVMAKKPYRIKLDEKASLLGMSNDKDWALLANHTDKTLLRNIAAFEISKIAGMRWTPESYSVDLYLNGTYQGVYALTEHVKVSKERLNIDLVEPTDNSGEALTGDYLLELDFHFDEQYKFYTDLRQLPIMFKDPDTPTEAQFNYVKNFFNEAESVLYSDNFTDPQNGYRKYIDVASFINYYIVQELAKNVDGNMRGSNYLSLLRNGKIEQSLVWDFDIAFGNADHIVTEQNATSREADGWYIRTHSRWFDRFFRDPAFVSALKVRWNELKPELDQIPALIRERAAILEEPQSRNFGAQPNGAGWSISAPEWNSAIVRGSYKAEVDYLVDFVEKRIAWLDTNINAL